MSVKYTGRYINVGKIYRSVYKCRLSIQVGISMSVKYTGRYINVG